jgi:hypothetical protein
MKPLTIHRQGNALLGRDGLTWEGLPGEFQRAFPDLSPKYIDDVSLLACVAAARAFDGTLPSFPEEQRKAFAIIVGTAFGAIDSTLEFDAQALEKGPNAVNPMDFPNTVANAAGSRIGIWMQLMGPNVTLTNGGTSLIDALGFGWEGYNSGLFQRCLIGAVDKLPAFLRPLVGSNPDELREGACAFLASGASEGDFLYQVTDYFAIQLKEDLSLPVALIPSFKRLLEGVEWLGCPQGAPLEALFPPSLTRTPPPASLVELGLGGLESLNTFLSAAPSCGVVGAFSKPERKISFIKIKK